MIGCFFGFALLGAEYILHSFCSLPQGFHYSGLQLIPKLKNSFRRFLLRVRSQKKGHPPILLNPKAISGCAALTLHLHFVSFCYSSSLAIAGADWLSDTLAVESHILCSQPQLINIFYNNRGKLQNGHIWCESWPDLPLCPPFPKGNRCWEHYGSPN